MDDVFDTDAEPLTVAVLPTVLDFIGVCDTVTVVVDVLLEEDELDIVAELKELLDCLDDNVPDDERSGDVDTRDDIVKRLDAEFVEDSVL